MIGPALAVATPAAILIADATSSSGLDVYSLIGSVGFPTAFAVMWLSGLIVSKREHDRVLGDRDEERAERVRQSATIERVLPALTRQTLVMEAALPLLEERVRLHALRDRDEADGSG